MRVIGFSPTEVTALLEVTAVVLKLGNVQLSSNYQSSGMEACSIAEPQGRDRDRDGPGGALLGLSTAASPCRAAGDLRADRAGPRHVGAGAVLPHRKGTGRDSAHHPQCPPGEWDRPLLEAWQPPGSRHELLAPLPRATMAGTHWPRTSTAASSTGW